MLRLIRWLFGLAMTLAVALPLLLLLAAIEPEPLVAVRTRADPAALAHAKALLERYDPRRDPTTSVRSIELSGADLENLIRFSLGQRAPAGAEVMLDNGRARIKASIEVPDNPLGRYVNLQLELIQVPDGVALDGLTIGRLEVPSPLAGWLGHLAHDLLAEQPIYGDISDTLVAIRISPEAVSVRYQWDPAVADRVKRAGTELLISEPDRKRLLVQTARIAELTRAGAANRKVSAADLIGAVFSLATERTAAPSDAAAENRTALIALGLYIRGTDIPRLLDVPADGRFRLQPIRLSLAGREDLAQHLLISAGVAAAAGGSLADALGLGKELDDSRSGSGFSFTDLAADRAGVRLAQSATGPRAAEVQRLLSGTPSESLFLPEITDLPEFLPESRFLEQFGGVGAPAYEQMTGEIEERIAALPVNR